MKIVTFLILVITSFNNLKGQNKAFGLEVNSYIKKIWTSKFTYAVNSITTNEVTTQGLNGGFRLQGTYTIKGNVFKLGGGYYKNKINEIKKTNRFGESNVRNINFESPLSIQFFTDKYFYDCYSISFGYDRLFELNKNYQILLGLTYDNYKTFKQYYHITYDNPSNLINNDFIKKENKSFGSALSLNTSLLKKIQSFKVGPTIGFSLFDILKPDKTFPDISNQPKKVDYLRAINLGLTINYSFQQK